MNETQKTVQDWYANNHSKVSGEARLDANRIQEFIGPNKKVLNLGCYRGELEQILAAQVKNWHALDFVQELIDHCNNLGLPGTVYFQRANITDLSFLLTNSYDVVLDMSTGDHLLLEDFKKMLVDVERVLIPGGVFCIAYYNLTQAGGPRDGYENYGYYRKDTPDEMFRMLTEAGLNMVGSESSGTRSYMFARKMTDEDLT